jgi:ferredoxin
MIYLIEIDEAACLAHGDCVDIAPDAFELDDVVRVVGTAPDETLLDAAEGCPSAAIRLLDPATRQQLYP